MNIWFTSDLHIGHEKIIEFCGRPFPNTTVMNMELVRRWNSVVMPDDKVYVLGDLAMGKLSASLAIASTLSGRKYLVPGNHDRCFSGYEGKVRPEQIKWYEDAGFTILPEQHVLDIQLHHGGSSPPLLLCHFPYVGDSQELARYADKRPQYKGQWLLHGHTHWATRTTDDHPRQIHVGVDAWHYYPVSLSQIMDIIKPTVG